jgi:hypothetical protein
MRAFTSGDLTGTRPRQWDPSIVFVMREGDSGAADTRGSLVAIRVGARIRALHGETRYAGRKRRVIIKAEVVRHPGRDPKNNAREERKKEKEQK